MNNTSILVMSSDGYSDCWQPFFYLKNKYWKCDYKTYICTETKDCKYAETIKTIGAWTNRLKQALEQIDTDYIILMLEDFFIHKEVNQEIIDKIKFDEDTAVYNFEVDYKNKGQGFRLRQNKEPYLCSCQPSIWDRKKLIEYLQKDMTAWEWEMQILDTKYKQYINTDKLIFDIGYYEDRKPWGITQGKISNEMIDLFRKENLQIPNREYIENPILSIIIPYYKTLELTKKLLNILIPQLNNKIEVILIDDGCNEDWSNYPIKVINQKNGGVSKARNTGLNNARGQYITFIDSDDEITQDYIEKCLKKSYGGFDYCLFSWKATGRLQGQYIIKDNPPSWNTSVWNCIYNRQAIGNIRFNENKQINEDTEFNQKVRKGKKANIEDILYIYNSGRNGSLTTRYSKGEIAMEEIKTQVVIYRSFLSKLGGIETAVYNLCHELKDIYDIVFVYDTIDLAQLKRLNKLVRCIKYNGQKIICDKFIYYGVNPQSIEKTIEAKEIIQQICNNIEAYPSNHKNTKNTSRTFADSKTSAKAFEKITKTKCEVLHNIYLEDKPKRVLNLMSATRLSKEKGYDRMKAFAKALIKKDIPFTWEVFTNDLPNEEIDGFIFRKPRLNVTDYMWNKDYIIQLSDFESWCGTITEALDRNVPIIATNWDSITEQIEDNKNGYILNMNMSNLDEVIDKMYTNNLKGFKRVKPYSIKEWINIIGYLGKPKNDYIYEEIKGVEVKSKVKITYSEENINAEIGTIFIVKRQERLEQLLGNNINKIVYVEVI